MSRLTIDITDHQHRRPKAQAALPGNTIRQHAVERLFPERCIDLASQELSALLKQRIEEGVSGKTVGAILDEELGSGPAR